MLDRQDLKNIIRRFEASTQISAAKGEPITRIVTMDAQILVAVLKELTKEEKTDG